MEDEGSFGSCTAQELAGALEYLERRDNVPFSELSRLFIYYNERVLDQIVGTDSGGRDWIKTLVKNGICNERI